MAKGRRRLRTPTALFWELGERRLQHDVDNQELVDSFEHLYLDEDASTSGSPSASTSASVASASGGS